MTKDTSYLCRIDKMLYLCQIHISSPVFDLKGYGEGKPIFKLLQKELGRFNSSIKLHKCHFFRKGQSGTYITCTNTKKCVSMASEFLLFLSNVLKLDNWLCQEGPAGSKVMVKVTLSKFWYPWKDLVQRNTKTQIIITALPLMMQKLWQMLKFIADVQTDGRW